MKNTSYVTKGKGLRRAISIRKAFEATGYLPGKVDEYRAGIKSGRYEPGTLAFSVVDYRSGKPRFPGTVLVTPFDEIVVLASDRQDDDELRDVIREWAAGRI